MPPSFRQSIAASAGSRGFYGWVMVAVASLAVFASGPGQSHTFSVFVEPISRDLGISSASIATAYGLATLVAAFLLPQTGRLIDRYGPRRMLLAIAAALGVACMLFGAAANFLWLAVGFGLLRFLGQGSLMLSSANLVSQWFQRSRGVAMSLMALGFGVSMAVHPPLGQYLAATLGWREAWVILGALTWLLMLPAVALLVIDRPEDVGLGPDGETRKDQDHGTGATAISGISLKDALRTRAFYLVAFAWCSISMLVTTLHFYQVTVMTSQGVSPETAARCFTISAIAMVAMMPLVGRMFDRLATRYVFALGPAITAASLIGLTFAADTLTATLYAIVFGINNAFSMTIFGYIWPRYFGRRHLGSIQGTGQLIGVVGASLGPLPVGLALDLVGDPTWTIRGLAAYPLLAALLVVLLLRTPAGVTGSEHLE